MVGPIEYVRAESGPGCAPLRRLKGEALGSSASYYNPSGAQKDRRAGRTGSTAVGTHCRYMVEVPGCTRSAPPTEILFAPDGASGLNLRLFRFHERRFDD